MKLCRFELLNGEPGARSGIVFSGKIYETDGGEAQGVHEPHDIRLLPPIAPPSVRLFRRTQDQKNEGSLPTKFQYLNAGIIAGPQTIISIPPESRNLWVEAYFAVISSSDLLYATQDQAEDAVLGYSLFGVLVDDANHRVSSSSSMDFGTFLGPVVTTPDEIEDRVIETDRGSIPECTFAVKVNQIEVGRGETKNLPIYPAVALSEASKTAPIRSGDLIAIGPVVSSPLSQPLTLDDEVTITSESLGAITIKLAIPNWE